MSLVKIKLVKKSRVRHLIQNLFLFLLKKIFPKKNHLYKKKIKKLMNKMRSEPYFFCKVFFLRILYPKFFLLPSKPNVAKAPVSNEAGNVISLGSPLYPGIVM